MVLNPSRVMNQIEIGLQAYQIETWGVIGNTMAPFRFLLDFARAIINRYSEVSPCRVIELNPAKHSRLRVRDVPPRYISELGKL